MGIAETAAKKLLHDGAAAVGRGVAAFSFGLDGLWQATSGFFADNFAGVARFLVLPFLSLWHWIVAAVASAMASVTSSMGGLWHLAEGYISGTGIAETAAKKLLHGAGAAVARGVTAFSFCLEGLWQLISGFFADTFVGLAHLLVFQFESFWQWIVTRAGNAVTSSLGGLWRLVAGFFPNLFASLSGAAHHLLVLPLETFWRWLVFAMANAAGVVSSGINVLWGLSAGFLPHLVAPLTSTARDLGPKLEAFWRWVQSAAAEAFPYVLVAATVVLVVALVWFCGPAICAASFWFCRELVLAVCYLAHGIYYVGVAVARAVFFLLPACGDFCAPVTMNAPGAAGWLISRAAFTADPTNYFLILHSTGGAVVATAVFCSRRVAWVLAKPIARLFGASVGA